MKKQVLGLLFILVFLQPMTSRLLEYYNTYKNNPVITAFSISKDKSSSQHITLENILIEVDDEDEFSVVENEPNILSWFIEYHSKTYKNFEDSFSKSKRYYSTQAIFTKKPIYILCQHFLI